MSYATIDPNTYDQIRRALELSGSSEFLPYFAVRPKAVEAALRSAIESIYVSRLHRPLTLKRLEDYDEITTVLGWQIQALEHSSLGRSDRLSALAFVPVNEVLEPNLETWSRALQEIEALRKGAIEDFSVVCSAAFRSYFRAIEDKGSGDDISDLVINSPPPGEMLDVSSTADRLSVSRPTIYDWLAKGRLIGWRRGTKQGWVIPAEQIRGPEDVAEGIDAVLSEIGDAELAWDFLSNPWPFSGGGARPIDKLLEGGDSVKQVLTAAPGYLINMG